METTYASKAHQVVLAVILCAGFILNTYAADNYMALNLNPLPPPEGGALGGRFEVTGINASGQVIGLAQSDPRYDFTQYSTITGPNGIGQICSFCGTGNSGFLGPFINAINDSGRVVGRLNYQAFISDPDGMGLTNLGSLAKEPMGLVLSSANAVNASGQVVGRSSLGDNSYHAFITGPNGGNMTDLGTLGGINSEATGINAGGQVVGWSNTADGKQHAFITNSNGIGMSDLGTLGGAESFAAAINAHGQVVGWSDTTDGKRHAFITGPDGTGMTDLGTFLGGVASFATAINANGQVVGVSDGRAFVTGFDGIGMSDLNAGVSLPNPTAILSEARGINDRGQIIANAFLLTPIPEPETYSLMLAGLGLLGFITRRKKRVAEYIN